jgi:hypothetical protein
MQPRPRLLLRRTSAHTLSPPDVQPSPCLSSAAARLMHTYSPLSSPPALSPPRPARKVPALRRKALTPLSLPSQHLQFYIKSTSNHSSQSSSPSTPHPKGPAILHQIVRAWRAHHPLSPPARLCHARRRLRATRWPLPCPCASRSVSRPAADRATALLSFADALRCQRCTLVQRRPGAPQRVGRPPRPHTHGFFY